MLCTQYSCFFVVPLCLSSVFWVSYVLCHNTDIDTGINTLPHWKSDAMLCARICIYFYVYGNGNPYCEEPTFRKTSYDSPYWMLDVCTCVCASANDYLSKENGMQPYINIWKLIYCRKICTWMVWWFRVCYEKNTENLVNNYWFIGICFFYIIPLLWSIVYDFSICYTFDVL